MGRINQVFDDLIDQLKQDDNVASISIIGSGALNYRQLERVNDIDLLITVYQEDHESREVVYIEGKEFDFTYLSISTLARELARKSHIWLNLLSNAKHIFKRDSAVENMLVDANKTYADGPIPLSHEKIDYIRFNMTKKLEDLARRRNNTLNFQYLAGIFLKNLTESYFRLQNTWVPRDKKMIDVLFKRDILLYELVKATFKARDTEEHYKLIKDIHEYVLKPYGGSLATLKRQNSKMEE